MAVPSYEEIIQKSIFDLLSLQDISQEKKEAFAKTLGKTVENRVILRLDSLLDDTQAEEWKTLLDGSSENRQVFLEQNRIDIGQLALEEAALLKAELVFLLQDAPASANTEA